MCKTESEYFVLHHLQISILCAARKFSTIVKQKYFIATPQNLLPARSWRSNLAEVIQNPIYAAHFITVNNSPIQSHLIADSAFPLARTLLKPYAERPNMPRRNTLFNYRLSRCRSSVERAFGSLKNRFRCLHKKIEYSLDNTKLLIKAAIILHNICIMENDGVDVDWEMPVSVYKKPSCNAQSSDGSDVRDALTVFFLNNPL